MSAPVLDVWSPRAFPLLLLGLCVLLFHFSATVVQSSPIYTNHASNLSFALPQANVSAVEDGLRLLSINPTFNFTVSWSGDVMDQFILTVPPTVIVTAVGSGISQCTPSLLSTPPLAITFNATSVHQCTYLVTIAPSYSSGGWNGAMRLSYKAYVSGAAAVLDVRILDVFFFFRASGVNLACDWDEPDPLNLGCPRATIFVDHNSSVSWYAILAYQQPPPKVYYDTTYSTLQPGWFNFTVLSDNSGAQYLLSVPPQLTIQAAAGSPALCTPSASSSPPFLVTFPNFPAPAPQCNYTASWTTPFNDILLLSYISAASHPSGGSLPSTDIYIVFSNNCTDPSQCAVQTLASSSTAALPSFSGSSAPDAMSTLPSSATPATPMLSSSSPAPTPTTGHLCVLLYSLPGTVDYPWSVAYSLQLTYNSTSVLTSAGAAVAVLSGVGTRVFNDRFGASFSTSLTLTPASSSLLYLNSASVLDGTGLTFNLSSPTQLPGSSPQAMVSQLTVFSASGVVVEGGSALLDPLGQAVVCDIPGVVNTTIGASNVNALSVKTAQCQAPITFLNGLRPPVQPSASNGGSHIQYSYTISDNTTYSVTTQLNISTSSAFANAYDELGNLYQSVISIAGVRVYTYLPTSYTVTSVVSGVADVSASINADATQRFYPYALLSAAPGVYSVNSAPFLDAGGLVFGVSPAVPANGQSAGVLYDTVSVFLKPNSASSSVVLTELPTGTNPPLRLFQRQSYTFA